MAKATWKSKLLREAGSRLRAWGYRLLDAAFRMDDTACAVPCGSSVAICIREVTTPAGAKAMIVMVEMRPGAWFLFRPNPGEDPERAAIRFGDKLAAMLTQAAGYQELADQEIGSKDLSEDN